MAKIGRNEICPCGSGLKFKRCHETQVATPMTGIGDRDSVRNSEAWQTQRERQQGLGKPIVSAEIEGRRFVAVKNRLIHSKKWQTFHDFLMDYIKSVLGEAWGNAELAKAPDQRHPVIDWYVRCCDRLRFIVTKPGKVQSGTMTGALAAYLHLAYDLYSLDHNAELQEKLLARLRDFRNFEGARYEIFVAATLVRSGFGIEFENEDDRNSTHCEFTATHLRTKSQFSVEAKSREGQRLDYTWTVYRG